MKLEQNNLAMIQKTYSASCQTMVMMMRMTLSVLYNSVCMCVHDSNVWHNLLQDLVLKPRGVIIVRPRNEYGRPTT